MKRKWLPLLCANALLAGCCIGPTADGPAPEPLAIDASPPGTELDAAAPVAGEPLAAPLDADQLAVGPDAPLAAASPAPVVTAPATAPTAAAPPAPAAVPVGRLIADGTQYAYDDVGITLTLPAGWTQQLMTGGIIALFSDDYPATGTRDHGALMMVSEQKAGLPAADPELLKALKEGLDPAAAIEAGPIRFAVAGQPAAQVVASATDADGARYKVIHTIMQSGARTLSVKAITFDSLDRRKPLFDAVMESISVKPPARA